MSLETIAENIYLLIPEPYEKSAKIDFRRGIIDSLTNIKSTETGLRVLKEIAKSYQSINIFPSSEVKEIQLEVRSTETDVAIPSEISFNEVFAMKLLQKLAAIKEMKAKFNLHRDNWNPLKNEHFFTHTAPQFIFNTGMAWAKACEESKSLKGFKVTQLPSKHLTVECEEEQTCCRVSKIAKKCGLLPSHRKERLPSSLTNSREDS